MSTQFMIFLDDERPFTKYCHVLPGGSWVIARDFAQATDLVCKYGFPNFVSFDHDLGDGPTGYDFAKWLVERDLDHNDMPENFDFNVHSANPVGAANISGLLTSYKKQRQF